MGVVWWPTRRSSNARPSSPTSRPLNPPAQRPPAGLDMRRGDELSLSLNDLYAYSAKTLTEANLHNDVEKVREVARLIETVADAWKQVAAASTVQ